MGKGGINTPAGYRAGGRETKPTWVQRGRVLDIHSWKDGREARGSHEDGK